VIRSKTGTTNKALLLEVIKCIVTNTET